MTPRPSNSAGPNSERSPATRWRARGQHWRSSNVNSLTIGAHERRIDAAQAFADGGERTKALRDSAWAAHRAAQEARDAGQAAASDAARATGHAVGAAFLHPLPKATQVKHILGSAAHAARAFELSAGGDPAVGADHIAQSRILAPPVVVDVLRRYPSAPPGGGRVGELIRTLDASLRRPATDR
jgi:hypothetical protein